MSGRPNHYRAAVHSDAHRYSNTAANQHFTFHNLNANADSVINLHTVSDRNRHTSSNPDGSADFDGNVNNFANTYWNINSVSNGHDHPNCLTDAHGHPNSHENPNASSGGLSGVQAECELRGELGQSLQFLESLP